MRTLNLEEVNIQKWEYNYKNKINIYKITLVSRGRYCPECHTYSTKIHGYKPKKINHSIVVKDPIIILYRQRRYICPVCSTTFIEENPFVVEDKRMTNSLIEKILILLKDYNQTYSSVARQLNSTPTTVMNIFDLYVQIERKPLQEVICIDEFHFSRKADNRFACLLIGFKNGLILDVIESRRKRSLISYFSSIPLKERENVKFISMDMYDNYRDIAKLFFKNALCCADSFHVIKNINEALDKIRCKVMNRYKKNKSSDEYYLLKYQNKLLFLDGKKIDNEHFKYNHHYKHQLTNSMLLDKILSIDDELRCAYELKEQYTLFNQSNADFEELSSELDALITAYKNSDIQLFEDLGNTLHNWKKEILNSFHTYQGRRISNGPIEGRNKYIHIILTLANGYTNFERFRNRVLYVFNKYEKPLDTPTKENMTRKVGKKRGKYQKKQH